MGFENTNTLTLTAGAPVSQGRYLKMSSGKVIHATSSADDVIGVAAESAVADEALTVYTFGGKIEVEASAAIAADALVTVTTAGKAVGTTSAAARILGIALTASGADGEFFTVLHQPLPSHNDA